MTRTGHDRKDTREKNSRVLSRVYNIARSRNIKTDIKLTSFNVENARNNSHYVINDLSQSDIILLQETWLFQCETQSGTLERLYTEYDTHARGVDVNNPIAPSSLPRGYGGIAIMWKKNLTPMITKKKNGNHRIICIEIKNCYIINVYFPSGNDRLSTEEHMECTDILESIVQTIDYDKHILIAGDWNIDLFKLAYKRDKRRKKIIDFIKRNNLICLSGNPKPTYSDNRGNTSHIDLIVARNSSKNCFNDYQVDIHDKVPWNSSTHTPISIKLNVTVPTRPKEKHQIIKRVKIDWSTLDKYKYDNLIKEGMLKINMKSSQEMILNKSARLLTSSLKRSANTKIIKSIPSIKKPWNREIALAVADAKKTYFDLKETREKKKDTHEIEDILKVKKKAVRAAHRRYNAMARRKLLGNITEAALSKDAKSVSRLIKSINGGRSDISPLNIEGETIYDIETCTKKWAVYYKNLSNPDEKLIPT